MYVARACMEPTEVRKGMRAPGIGVTGGWEPCECWEPNSGALKEQQCSQSPGPPSSPVVLVLKSLWKEQRYSLSDSAAILSQP